MLQIYDFVADLGAVLRIRCTAGMPRKPRISVAGLDAVRHPAGIRRNTHSFCDDGFYPGRARLSLPAGRRPLSRHSVPRVPMTGPVRGHDREIARPTIPAEAIAAAFAYRSGVTGNAEGIRGVQTGPGPTQFTRMPFAAADCASPAVKFAIAPFVVAYASKWGDGVFALTAEVAMSLDDDAAQPARGRTASPIYSR
jgi:hypothetical protein